MIYNSFQSTILKYVNSSLILIVATILALVVANSPLFGDYQTLFAKPVSFSIGNFNFFSHGGHALPLSLFISDFLMAIFFLSVGLEIKREIICGELSSMKKALLPVIGACGGMIVPVLVFYFFCPDNAAEMRGMAIPMATDIAFSLGVLSMFGDRVPNSLKVFLATLAVADDLGGIIVIALFYTSELNFLYLGMAALVVSLMFVGNMKRVRAKAFYLCLGLALWYLLLNSGIHSTIAGVLTAFCIPCTLTRGTTYYVNEIRENIALFPAYESNWRNDNKPIVLTEDEVQILRSIEVSSDHLISPLQDLEDDLKAPINYGVIPLFAFASAGVCLREMSAADLFGGVGFAVLMGLVVGKVLGIFSFSWLAIKAKIVDMPKGTNWKAFASVCMLGGIGFTVSMFIAELSYIPMGEAGAGYLNAAKLGILCGSLLSGVIAYIMLHIFLPKATTSLKIAAKETGKDAEE